MRDVRAGQSVRILEQHRARARTAQPLEAGRLRVGLQRRIPPERGGRQDEANGRQVEQTPTARECPCILGTRGNHQTAAPRLAAPPEPRRAAREVGEVFGVPAKAHRLVAVHCAHAEDRAQRRRQGGDDSRVPEYHPLPALRDLLVASAGTLVDADVFLLEVWELRSLRRIGEELADGQRHHECGERAREPGRPPAPSGDTKPRRFEPHRGRNREAEVQDEENPVRQAEGVDEWKEQVEIEERRHGPHREAQHEQPEDGHSYPQGAMLAAQEGEGQQREAHHAQGPCEAADRR